MLELRLFNIFEVKVNDIKDYEIQFAATISKSKLSICSYSDYYLGQSPSMSSIAHSSHMDIFQNLAVDLETEGRYLFLNCIANQLR